METRCWLEFDNDPELLVRIEAGEFEDEKSGFYPWTFPPAGDYWTSIVADWCRKNDIPLVPIAHLVESAEVTKAQISDFITFVYGENRSYQDPAHMLTWKGRAYLVDRYNNLKAFVAKELRDDVKYQLLVDEF